MLNSLRKCGLGLLSLVSLAVSAVAQIGGSGAGPTGPQVGPMTAQPPRLVMAKAKMGEWVGAGPALYKVISHESGLRDYRQKYNQAGKVIHPGFEKDRLAVIEIEIRNVTDHPILPPIFSPALTDTDGVRTIDWKLDSRQMSFVTEHPRQVWADSSSPAEIAAGQIMKLSLVFSISPKAIPTALEFSPENFRDMPYRAGRPPQGTGGATAAQGQIGPRNGISHVVSERVPTIRVTIDLTAKAKP